MSPRGSETPELNTDQTEAQAILFRAAGNDWPKERTIEELRKLNTEIARDMAKKLEQRE